MGVSGWIAAVILGVVALAVYYPLESILVFAFLHNGAAIFLVRTAERLPRRLLFALAISPVVFILSGNAPDALAWYSLPGVGARNFLHVYLPEFLYGTRLGWRLFALAAYLQVVHYYCVLGFLPKTRRSLPKEVVIALSLVMIGAFSLDFLATRRIYSFLAGFHAWFEWPALLVIGQSTNPRWKLLNAKNLSSTAISPASGEALR